MLSVRPVLVAAAFSMVACRSPAPATSDATTSDAMTSDASRPAPRVPVSAAPPRGTPSDAGTCKADGDCAQGLHCYFEESGCASAGRCRASGLLRNCYKAIPVCSCRERRTFYAPGGCAGNATTEPWELYACPCATDADCRGGQRCVPVIKGMRRDDVTSECVDPKK